MGKTALTTAELRASLAELREAGSPVDVSVAAQIIEKEKVEIDQEVGSTTRWFWKAGDGQAQFGRPLHRPSIPHKIPREIVRWNANLAHKTRKDGPRIIKGRPFRVGCGCCAEQSTDALRKEHPMDSVKYVGLDVHRDTISAAVLDSKVIW